MVEKVYSGRMNRKVTFFEVVDDVDANTGEAGESLQELKDKWVERTDSFGREDDDFRLVDVASATYSLRYDAQLVALGGRLVVRDEDGDWQAVGPAKLMTGRKRYMQIKCRKRE